MNIQTPIPEQDDDHLGWPIKGAKLWMNCISAALLAIVSAMALLAWLEKMAEWSGP